ncbi:UNKNOWN [Stylonychia lemnae]|uniref:Uncharacterized protein n=1 Tax=Stylonychia lemnae TaxID=5949 RepID=A0A077ZYQ9_STYLE|nr:UNKNOWN [Stylonychia lemnae]|eukprot:CDW75035.1 UNKNOWN [Stylonychia lemnae]
MKTCELIDNYQSLLSDMKNQISHIKGRFQLSNNISTSQSQYFNQPEEMNAKPTYPDNIDSNHNFNALDTQRTLTNGMNTQSTFNQIGSPIMKIQDNQSSRISHQNMVSQDEIYNNNLLESCQSFRDLQHHHNLIQDHAFSPDIQKSSVERRQTENHESLGRREVIKNQQSRRILSSLNLTKSPSNNNNIANPYNENAALISTSSNYKFTNTSCGSPQSPKQYMISPQSMYQSRFDFQNQANKENQNINTSPMHIHHLSNHIPSQTFIKKQIDFEEQYYEQVKLNKQLIDQVKSLKVKGDQAHVKAQQEYDVKLIKTIQSEEYMQKKCSQMQIENQELRSEIQNLTNLIEGQLRSNQELEVFVENCEVSQAKFTDRQKTYNKKIQDLNKRNQDLRDQNIQLEDRVKLLEQDKQKLSEKWIRVSARQRVDDRNRSKVREKEIKAEHLERQIDLNNQKIELIEKENNSLKEENSLNKNRLTQLQSFTKDLQCKLEALEKEKFLADKVTNELLARIQRYESDINDLQAQNQQMQDTVQQAQRDQEDLKLIEQEMENMQEKMSQINSESIEIQTFNMQLEQDNQRLNNEVQVLLESQVIKDQQIQSLQLQLEHQNEQFKELQREFTDVIDQLSKKEGVLGVKFSQEDLQDAADYLISQIQLDQQEQSCDRYDNNTSVEDQTITFLIVKSAQKIKFLNKYIDGFKQELEEVSEKYDKLALKYRDSNKENDNLKNMRDVSLVQIDNYMLEIKELKQYIQELESMIKAGANTSQQINHFQETFQAASQSDMNVHQYNGFDRSPSLMHLYSSVSNDQSIQGEDYDDPNMYISMNSQKQRNMHQQQQSYQQQVSHQTMSMYNNNHTDQSINPRQSVKFLEKIDSNRRSINNLSSIQHSYDHSRVCLPTRLLQNQNSTFIANQGKVNQSVNQQSNSNEKNDMSLSEQIKNTLQHYKKQQQIQRRTSNSKSGKKSSILIKKSEERNAQQHSLTRSPINQNNDQQQHLQGEPYHSQRAVSSYNLHTQAAQSSRPQQLQSVRQSQSQASNLLGAPQTKSSQGNGQWDDYQESKKMKKTQAGIDVNTQQLPSYEEQMDGNYKKIHKILAVNNKNKDVREEIKDHLNEKPENQLSPGMEPVDKIYFRRRDEASQYAEFLFKSKVKFTQINFQQVVLTKK